MNSEVKFEVRPKTVFSFAIIIIGVILILHAVYIASLGIEDISILIETEDITEFEAFTETLGWFFGLLIEILGGFFLGIIGTRIKK